MIEMEEFKEAIESINEVTKVKIDNGKVFFYYGDSLTFLKVTDKDSMVPLKIEVTNSFKCPIDLTKYVKSGEDIARHINLLTDTPCKTIYVKINNSHGAFLVRNIFTDKLDDFSDEIKDIISRKSKIKILILGMMLENYACYKELSTEMEKITDEALK